MLTFPTRAKMLEMTLSTDTYGLSLLHQLSIAVVQARNVGRPSVEFSFDPMSHTVPKNDNMNKAFVEYLKMKKYFITKERQGSFVFKWVE